MRGRGGEETGYHRHRWKTIHIVDQWGRLAISYRCLECFVTPAKLKKRQLKPNPL